MYLLRKWIFLLRFSLIFALGIGGLSGCASKSSEVTPSPSVDSNPSSDQGTKTGTGGRLVPRGLDYSRAVDSFAFGSCADQDKEQPLWQVIDENDPELFVFIGDTVYNRSKEQITLSEEFSKLDQKKEYRALREKIPFLAIWDDHDYGQNDGGESNPNKDQARKEFLNYWSYIKDSIGLNQGPLYHEKTLGGTLVRHKSRRRKISKTVPSIQFIMLDTRWNRSPLKPSGLEDPLRKYQPSEEGKMLSSTQWEWLESQLREPTDLKILVSSIQVIPEAHGFEKWANFPKERKRLLDLIQKTKPKNLVILSGDRHLGAISKLDLPGWGPLYEVTASAINRPSTLAEEDGSYLGPVFGGENFGLAQIDWKSRKLKIELKNLKNETVNKIDLRL